MQGRLCASAPFVEDEEGPERDAFIEQKRDEYREGVDLLKLASELVVDTVVQPEDLREELTRRYRAIELAGGRDRHFSERHNPVSPG